MNPLIVTLGFRSILLGVVAGLDARRRHQHPERRLPDLPHRHHHASAGSQGPHAVPHRRCIIYAISWFVLRQTKLGRYTYAMGGNETATRLSGINVDLYKIVIYGISGLLAAIGGILVMGRLQSGAYQNGTNMTLTSVAAVVIGGTSLSGGIGGIWGTLIGVFIMRLVEAGLVYLSVPSNAKEIVIGAIIVLAVALDVASARAKSPGCAVTRASPGSSLSRRACIETGGFNRKEYKTPRL